MIPLAPPNPGTESGSVEAPAPAVAVNPPSNEAAGTDFMILPDGTIYARNLTPELARMLADLNPHDTAMALRAASLRPCP